jgi:hypothetical protein
MHGRTKFARSVCVSLFFSWGAIAASNATNTRADEAEALGAPALVQAALDAELAGDAQGRDALLAQALAVDPDYGPARWHNGQVLFDGQWRSLADVQQLASYHRRWTEYRELRASLGGTVDDHVTLAEWCRENGLSNEERFHWGCVLLLAPDHAAALERLGLHEDRGLLLTEGQAAQLEDEEKAAKKDFARFRREFVELCRDATSEDAAVRAAALARLGEVDDVAALEALEFAVLRASERVERCALDLQLALVAAMSQMPQNEATLRLLDHAVYSPLPEVRAAAAQALQPRPQTDYVPLLMAALTAPIDVEIGLFAAPDGTVRLTETLFQVGAEANAAHVRSINYETEGALAHDPSRNNPGAVLATHLTSAAAIAEDTIRQVEDANAEAEARNARIIDVLKSTVGFDPGSDVEAWWSAWQEYNELQPTSDRPVYDTYEEETHGYVYAQGSPVPTIGGDMRNPTTPTPVNTCCCFQAGTLVWTQGGPIPIERAAVGDMVLCQHPATGELAYRPVLEVIVGLPTRVLRLEFPEETIVATLGHRFWVNGRGWEMAKFLDSSSRLHALGGSVAATAIAEGEQESCYNLVVDEFHTYFVGKSQLLVHDNFCPRPVLAAVPGSATLRASGPRTLASR